MINSKGIIQNNKCVGEFLKNLKNGKTQYKTLTKLEERNLIDKYMSENREDELRQLLVLHNIRMVFSIAKKYCKDTRDFDNMLARGLYGLTYAANRFNLYEPIKIKVKVGARPVLSKEPPYKPLVDEDSGFPIEEAVYINKVRIDPITCKPDYIKFCTYANRWVFKYIVDEFGKKSIKIDNNSISIDDKVKIKNSFDNNQTMENYVDDMISPDYIQPKSLIEKVSDDDVSSFYKKIGTYLKETNELTALEKQIVYDTYYNNKKVREIAEATSENPQSILIKKQEALKKLKRYLTEQFNIQVMSDIV